MSLLQPFLLATPYLALMLRLSRGLHRVGRRTTESHAPASNTTVTLVVACHNEEERLPQFLDSIKRQTTGPDTIVIADDHSTDNSPALLDAFAAANPNTRIIRNKHRGKKQALIEAVGLCQTEYILFTDADCILHPDYTVSTFGTGNLKRFFRQRTRWASKTPAYTDTYTILVALTVALSNIAILALLPVNPLYSAIILAIKAIADLAVMLPYLRIYTSRRQRRRLMAYFPLMSLLYPIYCVATVLLSLCHRPKGSKDSKHPA